jgi:hypothetical protein
LESQVVASRKQFRLPLKEAVAAGHFKKPKPQWIKKGEVRNPKGRPVGSKNKSSIGRRSLLQLMDDVLQEPEVQASIREAFRDGLTCKSGKQPKRKNARNVALIMELLRLNINPLIPKGAVEETAQEQEHKGVNITLDSSEAAPALEEQPTPETEHKDEQ